MKYTIIQGKNNESIICSFVRHLDRLRISRCDITSSGNSNMYLS